MGQDFYRRVEGYNKVFHVYGAADLIRNATLTVAAPAGPGRVEQVLIMIKQTTTELLKDDLGILTIDDITVLNSTLWLQTFVYDQCPFWGPISGYQRGSSYTIIQLWRQLDYETSLSLAIKNTASPDPSIYFIVLWGRKGS